MHSLRSYFKKKVFANATGMIESGSSKFRKLMTYLVEERIEIAKSMMEEGIANDVIRNITGIDLDDVVFSKKQA